MNTESVKNGVFTVFEKGAKLSDLRGHEIITNLIEDLIV